MKTVKFSIEECDPDVPWWEEVEDHSDLTSAAKAITTYRKAWPEIKWRIVRTEKEILSV